MRIALLSPLIYRCPPETTGGTERIVHDLAAGLTARGHEVTVFAARGSAVAGELVDCGPAIAEVAGAPPGLPAAREAVMLDLVAARADRFDIIHCHTEFMYAPVLRAWRDRLVTTIHWRVDEADRIAFFDHFTELPVVAISEHQRRALPPSASCPGVVHHGLDRERFSPCPRGEGYVAFLGRLTDQKGPDRAIDAARDAGLPIRLAGDIDVGNPTYHERHVVPRLGEDAVHVGPIGDREKQDFLGGADVFCFPIDWPEPFGLVMIEAMACGTPVVALGRGAVPEIVEHGVSGFVVDTEADLPAALLAARKLDRRRVRAAFDARFTNGRMAADYEAIYRQLKRTSPG